MAVVDTAVTLNLLPLVATGLTTVQSFGLLSRVEIPEFSAGGDPEAQRAELSVALGFELPDAFGQVVVYDGQAVVHASATVDNAQRLVIAAKRALTLLVVVAVVLLAATIMLARRRSAAVLLLGLGTAAATLVLRTAVHPVVERAPDVATQPGGRAAIDALVRGSTPSLLRLTVILALCGLVAAAMALLIRRRYLPDLVLVGAFAIAIAPVAVAGFSLIAVAIGLLLGIVVAAGGSVLVSCPLPGTKLRQNPEPAGRLAPLAESEPDRGDVR